jgi:hypothetical protein
MVMVSSGVGLLFGADAVQLPPPAGGASVRWRTLPERRGAQGNVRIRTDAQCRRALA